MRIPRPGLFVGLEEHVQVEAGIVALEFLENVPAMIVPGKLGLSHVKVKVLELAIAGAGFFATCRAGGRRRRFLAAANHHHVRRDGNADRRSEAVDAVSRDRKPQSGVKQVAGIGTDVGELQPSTGLSSALSSVPSYSKLKRGARVFRDAAVQRETHGRILRVALGGQRLVVRVGELGNAQPRCSTETWPR
jgi:hypothetical protein